MPETRAKSGRGYVVLGGTIGGEYARGSIIPEGRFSEERIDHWVAKGVLRRANEDDVEAARGVQPSGSILDTGSRVDPLTPEEQARANASARQAEITRLEALVERLKREDAEAREVEEHVASEQTRAMEAARERQGLGAADKDPRAPHSENPSPESTQSSSDDPTPHDAKDEPDKDSPPPARPSGRIGR